MTFLTWRLYRVQWAIAAALLAAFAAVELATGLSVVSHWHAIMAMCQPNTIQGPNRPCGNLISAAGNDLRVLSVLVPAIVRLLVDDVIRQRLMPRSRASSARRAPGIRPAWDG